MDKKSVFTYLSIWRQIIEGLHERTEYVDIFHDWVMGGKRNISIYSVLSRSPSNVRLDAFCKINSNNARLSHSWAVNVVTYFSYIKLSCWILRATWWLVAGRTWHAGQSLCTAVLCGCDGEPKIWLIYDLLSALTLLVRWRKWHLACRNLAPAVPKGCSFTITAGAYYHLTSFLSYF